MIFPFALNESKKILPSITDSSIRIGVIYLRIETGPNALLALFFFIYDEVASRFSSLLCLSPKNSIHNRNHIRNINIPAFIHVSVFEYSFRCIISKNIVHHQHHI